MTVSANATTAPDGATTADKIIGSAVAGTKTIFQSVTVTTGQPITISCFFKKSEYKLAFMRMGGQTGAPYVIYDLDTQAVVSTSGATSTAIQDVGDGWYRVSVTFASASGTNLAVNVSFAPDTGYTIGALNVLEYTGDDTSGGFVWQADAVISSVATSPIVTTAGTASRVADAITQTSASSLIGQTEGTIFAEVDWRVFAQSGSPVVGIVALNVGANNGQNSIVLGIERLALGTNRVYCFVNVANVTQAELFGSNITSGRYKIALAYKQDDFALYVNGVSIATDTSGTVPATSEVRIGTRFNTDTVVTNDHVRSVALFPTRLANATLASITA
jgi:hypothetical protein